MNMIKITTLDELKASPLGGAILANVDLGKWDFTSAVTGKAGALMKNSCVAEFVSVQREKRLSIPAEESHDGDICVGHPTTKNNYGI